MPSVQGMNLAVVMLRDGRDADFFPLGGETVTFGREDGNTVTLPDPSVSRRHAELRPTEKGVVLRDLGSRNGVKVNRVPRAQATLLPGDIFEIGIFQFRLQAGLPGAGAKAPRAALRQTGTPAPAMDQTMARQVSLPGVRHERDLATLYHACFWITDCPDASQLAKRMVELLRESTDAEEVQYYTADLELAARAGRAGKPAVKMAPFLAEKFQGSPEAVIVPGAEVAGHQRGVGSYNYLSAPLRRAGQGGPVPFVLLMRPVEWEPFPTEQRVLLQAIAQLWAGEVAKLDTSAALQRENSALKQKVTATGLLGSSGVLADLRARARRAAATKATVLLQGETGSGKELVAQLIHDASPRAASPFVKMNCAAIPDGLIESELFGHLRGAFTDAKAARKGKFQQAHGGTLFLDEIGEMPLAVQAKVLRAIENGEVEPLGGEKVEKVDVRVIAATHRDLAEMVARREFREDLLFRLNVFNLRIPPLREHAGDVEELAAHFLDAFCRENGLAALAIDADALEMLRSYHWPGNVRQLRNAMQRAAILASGPAIGTAEIREALSS